jgi:hypothetical protein
MAVSSGNAPTSIKSKLILAVVLLSPIAIVMAPSTLVLLAAMVPTIVARMVDTAPGHRLTHTVGATNLVGSLYFLHQLWLVGHSFENVMPILSDSFGWLYSLTGAGIGWVIFGFMPAFIRQIAAARSAVRLRQIRRWQEALIEEWGEEVRKMPSAEEK